MGKALLLELLKNPWLAETIDELNGARSSHPAADRYDNMAAGLRSEEFYLPVAGIQGAGKSTFLNALLFDAPILPIDVAETTCAPTEIRGGPEVTAHVHFNDGRTEEVETSEESLSRFVNNEFNRGNRRGVRLLRITTNDPLLLGSKMVMVDLPGVGSLTPENVQTTMEYLGRAAGMIYLLRTNPPSLTQREALFLATVWPMIPVVFFVQNRWNGDSERDAQEALKHNRKTIEDLAKQIHVADLGNLEIAVVEAHQGMKARVMKDRVAYQTSSFPKLTTELIRFIQGWSDYLENSVGAQLRSDIQLALRHVAQRISDTRSDRESVLRSIRDADFDYYHFAREAEKRCRLAQGDLQNYVEKNRAYLRRWRRNAKKRLRNKMRTKMRGGLVDGPRLSQALIQEQQTELDAATDTIQESSLEVRDTFVERFGDMPGWDPFRLKAEQDLHIEERQKFESLLPAVGSSAGGIGGMWAGAKIGATVGSAGGPPGTIFGGFVGGFAGGLLGTWLGSKAKAKITVIRADSNEPQVFEAIESFCDEHHSSLWCHVEQFSSTLGDSLDGWVSGEKRAYEHQRAKRVAGLELNKEDRNQEIDRLNEVANRLQVFHDQLEARSGEGI